MPHADNNPFCSDPPETEKPATNIPVRSLRASMNSRRARASGRGFTKAAATTRAIALPDPHLLTAIFEGLRNQTRALTIPLSVEDQCVQSMADTSPTKWHLAHSTWFFETFILSKHQPDYRPYAESFRHLFNSPYESVGTPYPRARRGLLSRPSCADISRYRAHVDEHIVSLIAGSSSALWEQIAPLIVLGCHHEQQHQERILADILHAFSCHPEWPAYSPRPQQPAQKNAAPMRWINFPGGDYEIGHRSPTFAFDNEGPCHVVKLPPFAIASRAVSNGDWVAFMSAGGYDRPELWLADGWGTARSEGWKSPLYWVPFKGTWQRFSLGGLVELDPSAPVCHISYYEADAYARWIGKRLPTETEWEIAAVGENMSPLADVSTANLLENGLLDPTAPTWGDGYGPAQMFGDVWEWTQSPYTPYPGYKASSGAIGEYNTKFMVNQMVLRGGSCITPASHIRATYRNYLRPHIRWQFSGLRLAHSP